MNRIQGNIYLMCLKHGYDNKEQGITYWEMVDFLVSSGMIDGANFEFHQYFYVWFFDNFYLGAVYLDRRLIKDNTGAIWFNRKWLSGRYGHPTYEGERSNSQLDEKAFMMFEARQNYLNNVSLHESDKKAAAANRFAIYALAISVAALLTQSFIGS